MLAKNKAIAGEVEELSRYRTIRSARKSHFSTLGKWLRSLSPIKRDRTVSNLLHLSHQAKAVECHF